MLILATALQETPKAFDASYILYIVLAGVGAGLFWYLKAQHERQIDADKWTRNLVDGALASSRKSMEVQQKVSDTISALTVSINENTEKSQSWAESTRKWNEDSQMRHEMLLKLIENGGGKV